MTSGVAWERQKREIEAYNTFYSAFPGRVSDRSFSDRGYLIRGFFPEIPISDDEYARPDFLLYNGEIFLQIEVKQGNNFAPRHETQMERCNSVSIENAEEYLKDNQVDKETPYDGNVESIQAAIAYTDIHEAYIGNCRHNWDDCREQLEILEETCPILAAERGNSLRVVAGEFDDPALQQWLEKGIALPETPKREIVLTEGMERESLAVAICHEWGHRALTTGQEVQVTVERVRDYFRHRGPSIENVSQVLRYLSEIGACDRVGKRSDRAYVFNSNHTNQILDIETQVSDLPVNQYFTGSEEQAGLGAFQEKGDE